MMDGVAIVACAMILAAIASMLFGCESLDFSDSDHAAPHSQTGGKVRAHFLDGWRTSRCSLVWLSHQVSDGDFRASVALHKAAGYTDAFCYMFNDGDCAGIRVDAAANLALATARAKHVTASGLRLWLIVVADDSPRLTGKGATGLLEMFYNCAALTHHAHAVVTGIELAESWQRAAIDALGSGLKARGFRVGHHTMPFASAASYAACGAAWCDYALIQVGNPFKRMALDKATAIIDQAERDLSARVVAFEHDVQLDGAAIGAEGGWANGRGKK